MSDEMAKEKLETLKQMKDAGIDVGDLPGEEPEHTLKLHTDEKGKLNVAPIGPHAKARCVSGSLEDLAPVIGELLTHKWQPFTPPYVEEEYKDGKKTGKRTYKMIFYKVFEGETK